MSEESKAYEVTSRLHNDKVHVITVAKYYDVPTLSRIDLTYVYTDWDEAKEAYESLISEGKVVESYSSNTRLESNLSRLIDEDVHEVTDVVLTTHPILSELETV